MIWQANSVIALGLILNMRRPASICSTRSPPKRLKGTTTQLALPDIEDEVALPFPERVKVRKRLLTWYHANRRRLPWRGDPPPYDTRSIHQNPDGNGLQKGSKKNNKISRYFAKKAAATETPDTLESRQTLKSADETKVAEIKGSLPVSAYQTWVSEVMLQQTRVETVIEYYTKWMQLFPSIEALANATPEEVNAAWAGLGYYRRARSLHEGAKAVVADPDLRGNLPNSAKELQARIKGVGPYTAGAVASIAYGEAVPVVDGNIVRVFARLHAIDHPRPADVDKKKHMASEVNPSTVSSSSSSSMPMSNTTSSRSRVQPFRDPAQLLKPCWSLAEGLLDRESPGDFNQALMELGATVCTPRGARCSDCPVAEHCRARRLVNTGELEDVNLYPRKAVKKKPKEVELLVCVAVADGDDVGDSGSGDANSHYLLKQRPSTGLLANQWEFPSVEMNGINDLSNAVDRLIGVLRDDLLVDDVGLAVAKEASSSLGAEALIQGPIVHLFSHQRHTMHVLVCHVELSGNDGKGTNRQSDVSRRWMDQREMNQVGITTGMKKVLAMAKKTRQ